MNIYNEQGVLVYAKDLAADKGLNYYDYDLSIDASRVAALQKALKKAKSPWQDKLEMKDNEKFYLIPGQYEVELVQGEQKATATLQINKPRERPRRGERQPRIP